ncbi:MAG TPA: hypothetical protein VL101_09755, partial [Nordella sp.]|nr:hypothetical protein [Nordella sp.]
MTLIETLDDPIICDMTLPWFTDYMVDRDVTLPRFKKAGIDFVSLTVSVPENSLNSTIRHIARVKAHIAARPDELAFVTTAEAIF